MDDTSLPRVPLPADIELFGATRTVQVNRGVRLTPLALAVPAGVPGGSKQVGSHDLVGQAVCPRSCVAAVLPDMILGTPEHVGHGCCALSGVVYDPDAVESSCRVNEVFLGGMPPPVDLGLGHMVAGAGGYARSHSLNIDSGAGGAYEYRIGIVPLFGGAFDDSGRDLPE